MPVDFLPVQEELESKGIQEELVTRIQKRRVKLLAGSLALLTLLLILITIGSVFFISSSNDSNTLRKVHTRYLIFSYPCAL